MLRICNITLYDVWLSDKVKSYTSYTYTFLSLQTSFCCQICCHPSNDHYPKWPDGKLLLSWLELNVAAWSPRRRASTIEVCTTPPTNSPGVSHLPRVLKKTESPRFPKPPDLEPVFPVEWGRERDSRSLYQILLTFFGKNRRKSNNFYRCLRAVENCQVFSVLCSWDIMDLDSAGIRWCQCNNIRFDPAWYMAFVHCASIKSNHLVILLTSVCKCGVLAFSKPTTPTKSFKQNKQYEPTHFIYSWILISLWHVFFKLG